MKHYKRKIRRTPSTNFVFATAVRDPNNPDPIPLGLSASTIGLDGETVFDIFTESPFEIVQIKTNFIYNIVPVNDLANIVELRSRPNTFFSGYTGPSNNILISFEQKIKDLGIYTDVGDQIEVNSNKYNFNLLNRQR